MQPRYTDSTVNRSEPPSQSKSPPRAGSPPREKAAENKPKRTETRRADQKPVEFTLNAPQASSVVVAGSFNDWNPQKTRLKRDGDAWKTSISLAPGRYEI